MMTPLPAKVACVGECMVELRETAPGTLVRGFGGDTLNTAVYLARLGVAVDYMTALGDDGWSDEMVAAWVAEGVGTQAVRRVPGRLPGLYVIQTDTAGERQFLYWRDSAPARALFDDGGPSLAGYDVVYFSGITLSLYAAAGRAALFDALARVRAAGGRVAFDTNYRARGWPQGDAAPWYLKALGNADIVFASVEDMAQVFEDWETTLAGFPDAECVVKMAQPAVRVGGAVVAAPTIGRVVDTTAAGDSFAAAYLAARLRGSTVIAAAEAGHRLAGTVVQYPGAIIPREAMP